MLAMAVGCRRVLLVPATRLTGHGYYTALTCHRLTRIVGVVPLTAALIVNTSVIATFADLAAFGGALVLLQHDVTVARTGTDLFLALDVAILTHAGHAGNEFFDYLHDDRLSFVGAVLIRRRQTRDLNGVGAIRMTADESTTADQRRHQDNGRNEADGKTSGGDRQFYDAAR